MVAPIKATKRSANQADQPYSSSARSCLIQHIASIKTHILSQEITKYRMANVATTENDKILNNLKSVLFYEVNQPTQSTSMQKIRANKAQLLKKGIKKIENSIGLNIFCLSQVIQKIVNDHMMHFSQHTKLREIVDQLVDTILKLKSFFITDSMDKDQMLLTDLFFYIAQLENLKTSLSPLLTFDDTHPTLKLLIEEYFQLFNILKTHAKKHEDMSLTHITAKAKKEYQHLLNLLQTIFNNSKPSEESTSMLEYLTQHYAHGEKIAKLWQKLKAVRDKIVAIEVIQDINELDNSDTNYEKDATYYDYLDLMKQKKINKLFYDLHLFLNNIKIKQHKYALQSYKSKNHQHTKLNEKALNYLSELSQKIAAFNACFEIENSNASFDLLKIEKIISAIKKIASNDSAIFAQAIGSVKPYSLITCLMNHAKNFNPLAAASLYHLPLGQTAILSSDTVISSALNETDELGDITEQELLNTLQTIAQSLALNLYLLVHSINDILLQMAKENIDEDLQFEMQVLIDEMVDEVKLWFISDAEKGDYLDLAELHDFKQKLPIFQEKLLQLLQIIISFEDNSPILQPIVNCLNKISALYKSAEQTIDAVLAEVFDYSHLQKPPQHYLLKKALNKAVRFVRDRFNMEIVGFDKTKTLATLHQLETLIANFQELGEAKPRVSDHLIAKKLSEKITKANEKLKEICENASIDQHLEDEIQRFIATQTLTQEQKKRFSSANDCLYILKRAMSDYSKEDYANNQDMVDLLIKKIPILDKLLVIESAYARFSSPKAIPELVRPYFAIMQDFMTLRFQVSNSMLAKRDTIYAFATEYLNIMQQLLGSKSKIKILKELLHDCFLHAAKFSEQVYSYGDIPAKVSLSEIREDILAINEATIIKEYIPFEEIETIFIHHQDFIDKLQDELDAEPLGEFGTKINLLFTPQQLAKIKILSQEISNNIVLLRDSETNVARDFKDKLISSELLSFLLFFSRKCYKLKMLIQETNLLAHSHMSMDYNNYIQVLSAYCDKVDCFNAKERYSCLRVNLEDLRKTYDELVYLQSKYPISLQNWRATHPQTIEPLIEFLHQKSIVLPEFISPWKMESGQFFTKAEREDNFKRLEFLYKSATIHLQSITAFDQKTFAQLPSYTGRLIEICLYEKDEDQKELASNLALVDAKQQFEKYFTDAQALDAIPKLQFNDQLISDKIAQANTNTFTSQEKAKEYNLVISRLNFFKHVMTQKIVHSDGVCEPLAEGFHPLQIPWVRRYAKIVRSLAVDPSLAHEIPNKVQGLLDEFYVLLLQKYGANFYYDLYLEPDKFKFHI